MPRKHIVTVGQKIGTREVTRVFVENGRHKAELRCDVCGSVTTNNVKQLLKSAGLCGKCNVTNMHKTHGECTRSAKALGVTPEYRAWMAIHRRCYNTNTKDYPLYGGSGVRVAEEWHGPEGFSNFLRDMGRRPADKTSIDRIDPNGDYAPGNCRWADWKEQNRNKRTNKRLAIDGVTKTLIEWSEQYGIEESTIRGRLDLGWSIEQAVTTPPYTEYYEFRAGRWIKRRMRETQKAQCKSTEPFE